MREEWLKKQCACGSGELFENCCDLYINGNENAPTAEKLMRSRYSAFVTHRAEYIYETHDPDTRSQVSLDEIKSWSEDSDWEGLEIVNTEAGQSGDKSGVVQFIATYSVNNKKSHHHERSRFSFKDDRWYFTDGNIIHDTIRRATPKVGRNDPCPCGSGKKYKKCCGL